MNHNLSETDGLSITYLHGNKFFRRLGSLSTHLPRLDDAHDHLASPLDSFEGRRCRSVMIVFDSLDLLEDLCADPAHLQRQILPFQRVRRKVSLLMLGISEVVSTRARLYCHICSFRYFHTCITRMLRLLCLNVSYSILWMKFQLIYKFDIKLAGD